MELSLPMATIVMAEDPFSSSVGMIMTVHGCAAGK
jgi:hypothetical protein